jgi:hypothetical protein
MNRRSFIERLDDFHRFIPVSDEKEPCNGDLLKSLIENGKHKMLWK